MSFKCHLTNAQGEQCTFIWFAPGGSKSPSVSPPSMSTPTFLPPPLTLPTGLVPSQCPIQGCGQTHIMEDCGRQICHKHCITQGPGGCTSKKHKAANSSQCPPSMLPPQHAPLLSSTLATVALPPPITFTSSAEPRGSQATSHLNSNFPSEPLDA